jgi:hypothetical protein
VGRLLIYPCSPNSAENRVLESLHRSGPIDMNVCFSTRQLMSLSIFLLYRGPIHPSPSAARWVARVAALKKRATTARSSSEKPSSTPFISSM